MEGTQQKLNTNNSNNCTIQELNDNPSQSGDSEGKIPVTSDAVKKTLEEIDNQNSNQSHQSNESNLEQHQSSPNFVPNDKYYPLATESPIYPGNVNIIYYPPESNNFPVQMPIYGNNFGVGYIHNNFDQVINPAIPMSFDVNGTDLPYSDIPTLRFFFNLGIEYFRVNHGCQMGPPMAFSPGPGCYLPENTMPVPVAKPVEVKTSNESIPSLQSLTVQPRPNSENRRRSMESNNFNRPRNNNYNSRNNYFKRDFHDNKNPRQQDSSKNYKSKPINKTNINNNNNCNGNNKDMNDSNNNNAINNHHKENNEVVDNRKNAGNGRFRRNDGRVRMDKPGNYYQPPVNNYGYFDDSNKMKHEKEQHRNNQIKILQKSNPVTSSEHQTIQPISQPIYSNVLPTSNDTDNYFTSNEPVYTVPYVINNANSVKDTNNTGNYNYNNVEKYSSPPIYTNVYTPIPYLPPPLYSPGPAQNSPKKWYPVPQYIAYPTQVHNHQSNNMNN